MLNWFKKKPVEKVVEPVKTVVTPLPPPLPPPRDEVVYQVGKTESGKITLRLGDGYSSGTLTMNAVGVYRLIDMLEAAIDTSVETEGQDDTART